MRGLWNSWNLTAEISSAFSALAADISSKKSYASREKWQNRGETTSLHDVGIETRFATTRRRGEIKLLFYSFSLTEAHVF
jgi:hypothetical protein